jgi:hypothetical protein
MGISTRSVATGAGHRSRIWRDVYNGAVRGDFAPEIGLAGALAQIALGFVPVVGTLCAARDLIASSQHGDRIGALLNGVALVPFFGGVSKAAEVLHHIRHLHAGLTGSGRQAAATRAGAEPIGARGRNTAARISFITALLVPVLMPLLVLGAALWLMPPLRLDPRGQAAALVAVALLVPFFAVVSGHLGLRRARRIKGHGARRGIALAGLILGYLYFALVVAIGAVVVLAV